MNDATLDRISGIAGILFGVLVALAFLMLGDSPDFVDDPDEIGGYFVDNEGKIFGAAVFALLAAFVLAWFGNGLRDALRTDDGSAAAGAAGGAGVVAIGAAIAASAYAISGAILVVGAQRVSEHDDAGAASAFLNYDLFQMTYGAAAPSASRSCCRAWRWWRCGAARSCRRGWPG